MDKDGRPSEAVDEADDGSMLGRFLRDESAGRSTSGDADDRSTEEVAAKAEAQPDEILEVDAEAEVTESATAMRDGAPSLEAHIAERPDDESDVTTQDGSPIPYPDLPGSSGGSSSVPEPPSGGWGSQPTPGDQPLKQNPLGDNANAGAMWSTDNVMFEGKNTIGHLEMTAHSGSGPLPDTNTQTSRVDGDQQAGGDPEGDGGSTAGGGSTVPTPGTQSFEPVDEPVELDPALDEPFETDLGLETEPDGEAPFFDEADAFDLDLG